MDVTCRKMIGGLGVTIALFRVDPFPKYYVPIRCSTIRMERITAVANGRVQGVGYRAFIGECARATGVHGFVKNLPDGTVQIVAESSQASLDNFIRLAHARNDSFIRVNEITVKRSPATEEFPGFRVEW
jgi:acylphosphatase